MEQLFTSALKYILQKDTIFFGLFLIGYYLQIKDKEILQATNKSQQDFLSEQQIVLKELTGAVQDISNQQEKHGERLERIEAKLYRN